MDVIERISSTPDEFAGIVTLDRAEQVRLLHWCGATDQQVAEVLIAQDTAKCPQGLAQDLFAMRDKKQRRLVPPLPAQSGVVKRRNHRLTSSRGCDNQMAILLLHLAFSRQNVQDFFLERVGPQVEHGGRVRLGSSFSLSRNGLAKSIGSVSLIGLKLLVLPVCFERSGNLAPEMRKFVVADLGCPFQSFRQRCIRKIRRTDVGAAKAGFPVKQIRLGVQSRPRGCRSSRELRYSASCSAPRWHLGSVAAPCNWVGDLAQIVGPSEPVVQGELLQILQKDSEPAPGG
jgi:hypothetical protein